MYEKFRNEFLEKLVSSDRLNIDSILNMLDIVSMNYEFSEKQTSMTVYMDDLPDAVKIYLVVKKMQGLSDSTLKNYKLILEMFFKWARKNPNEINSNDIRMFLFWYSSEHKISLRTLDKYREYLSYFFTWCCNEEYISKNPSKNISKVKYETKMRQALTQMELEKLRLSSSNIRNSAILEVFYSTGCRVSELINLKLSDIDWTLKTVSLFGKGKKHRISYLNAKAELTLKNYLQSRTDDSEWLFVSLRKPYHQLTKCGIEKIIREMSVSTFGDAKKVTPHIIRHTTATTALERGMPITDVSKLLGHVKVETTMIYAEVSDHMVHESHTKCVV